MSKELEKEYLEDLENIEADLIGLSKHVTVYDDGFDDYLEDIWDRVNTIKQSLIKAQEQEKVLEALKNHLHILPMSDGNDVIGIGCPANEDVIEPNDFGYDIIKEWLRKDKSE